MASKGLCCSRKRTAEVGINTGMEIVLVLDVHLGSVVQRVGTQQEHHLKFVVRQNDVAAGVQLHDYVIGCLAIAKH